MKQDVTVSWQKPVYPQPGAARWEVCTKGHPFPCPTCTPPPQLVCPENRAGLRDPYYQCKELGEHTTHRDGHGTSWWPEDEKDDNDD